MTRLRKTLLALAAAAVLAALAPALAQAAASDWSANEQARLRLISADRRVGEGTEMRLGLQFQLEPGWKIYWRSPGEAGYPPRIDWSGSRNLAGATVHWPVPHRFELFGLQTFGYGGEVVLPIVAQAGKPGEAAVLRASVDYLTCSEICVPRRAQLALTLPPGPAEPSYYAYLIERGLARVPGDGASSGLSLRQAVLTGGTESPELSLVVTTSAAPFEAPDATVEGVRGHNFGKPRVELTDDGRRALLRLPVSREGAAETALAGQRATLTVFDGERGLEREIALERGRVESGGLPAAGGGGPVGGSEALRFAGMLGLAVLGGLILNLMPCVLPVLSLKLLKVVGHGGRELAQVRASFLASAAGILAAFMVLAAAAIALKGAGAAVGWGMQFQHPAFLVALTLVVTLFACNLFGFFEIPLPRFVADRAGGGLGGHEGMAGHFLTGALATLLATPCSAPFLGTAIAFALSRGVAEILAIFAALGLGLALPYLAVAAVPSLAVRMPRPGRWMVVVKRILGLALAATGVWLLSVLAAGDGVTAALAVGALMAALAGLLGMRGRAPRPLRAVLSAVAALLAIAAFAAPPGLGSAPAAPAPADARWRPLDQAQIGVLVDRGNVVFVDITAEWCITCKVNKAAVLDSTVVHERLASDEVVVMRGDWTRPSERITRYLASFGRYGIPFNAVYGPGAREGIALPEILSRAAVLDAIDAAAGT